ncbi:MAG: type II 3-dehydroquinate dehydratase [Muribaculaceae bacterium]|nr:type II 3-dehydroquinate dehydratase [Muribaculaceae bacterium]
MNYYLVLNGPNLNLLGRRQPDIYGSATLEDINRELAATLSDGESLVAEQYSGEGEIIDALHRAGFDARCLGIVLNAGAYTHYSYAIADAIAAIEVPVVEVHISNIHARENFRSRSVIAPVCTGSISGFGTLSYRLALDALRYRHGS